MSIYVSTSLDAGRWRREPGPAQMLRSLLKAVLPLPTPDFELRYEAVFEWMLEIDEATGVVQREIGLDEAGTPIVVAPFRENVGFWTNASEPVEWQSMVRIRAAEFESKWARFHAP